MRLVSELLLLGRIAVLRMRPVVIQTEQRDLSVCLSQ